MKTFNSLKSFLLIVLTTGSLIINAQTDSIRNKPLGKLIDIGGWRLHLYGQGLNITKGPSVILENGIRGFSFDWLLVQLKVATFARVYAYDRAGSAWSDLGPRPHTMHQAVYELHTLLKKAEVPSPYVLVGASYGGLLVRLFAHQYPEEVAGLILVDAGFENGITFINGKLLQPAKDATNIEIPSVKTVATEEDNTLARTPEAKKAIGNAIKNFPMRVDLPYDKLPDSIQEMRLWALSQFEYYAANDNKYLMEERAAMIKEREKHPQMLDDRPLIVLTAGKSDKPNIDPEEQERLRNQAGMLTLSRNSKQVIAKQSGHHIQLDEPDLVANAIRQVIEAINKNERLKN